MSKGKAVFIDGASLSGMRYPLGIRSYDYQKLYAALAELGTSPIVGKPLYVVPKGGDGPWTKSLRTIGFDVVVSSTKNSEDDKLIIKRISALKREHVDEIVIVSTDQDYSPALQQKVNEGMRVYWLATKNRDRDGTSPLGEALAHQFEAGTFSFIDLADSREAVAREFMPVDDPGNPRKQVSVTLRVPILSSELGMLLRSVGTLLKRFPGASFTLESK